MPIYTNKKIDLIKGGMRSIFFVEDLQSLLYSFVTPVIYNRKEKITSKSGQYLYLIDIGATIGGRKA